MFQYFKIIMMTATLIALTTVGSVATSTVEQAELESQARSFLNLLDLGQKDEAWDAMSPMFQTLNDPFRWKRRQQAIRSTYGNLSSRDIHRISYRQTYALSPDGDYVIIQFKSSYQNKVETRETVVLDCRTSSACSIREYIIQ